MLYNSNFLSIEKRGNSLVQKWNEQSLSPEDFQKEVYNFLEVYLKVKPSSVLWLQEDFSFHIPENLQKWVEDEILALQIRSTFKDIAFTISKDKIAHQKLLTLFDTIEEENMPKFFLNEKDALNYLTQKSYNEEEDKIHYSLIPKKDRVSIDLTVSYDALPKTINSLNSLKKQLVFSEENKEKFNSLTQQEVLILRHVCKGMQTKEVAELLHIEASTVSTHRKKINKKLEAKSCLDLYRFAVAFNLIEF